MDPDSFPHTSDSDDVVCLTHITDPHLLKLIAKDAEDRDGRECAVCEKEGHTPAERILNLGALAEIVFEHAGKIYDHEGFYSDGEQWLSEVDRYEVVETVIFDSVDPNLRDTIVELIGDLFPNWEDWFERHSGDLDWEQDQWEKFERNIKHKTRFISEPSEKGPLTPPELNHVFITGVLEYAERDSGLRATLEVGTKLYRARTDRAADVLLKTVREKPAAELGPAPYERVAAGRMNAQGVAMLYAAFTPETACAEVVSHSPYSDAVVGEFIVQQPLTVIDLTDVPAPSSIFDTSQHGTDVLATLGTFVDRITRPVILDGNHPVDYAPTQVLTDAFRWWTEPKLDGIIYPSRVHAGGKNIVLFYGEPYWYESATEQASKWHQFKRERRRGNPGPVFSIDSVSIQLLTISRSFTVQSTGSMLWTI